jgi:hypothetical protein
MGCLMVAVGVRFSDAAQVAALAVATGVLYRVSAGIVKVARVRSRSSPLTTRSCSRTGGDPPISENAPYPHGRKWSAHGSGSDDRTSGPGPALSSLTPAQQRRADWPARRVSSVFRHEMTREGRG